MNNNPIYKTPEDSSYFFGFHDISPWNESANLIALHRVNKELIELPSLKDYAEIVLLNILENKLTKISKTNSWNYQQGSRLMWYPFKKDHLIFNYRNHSNKLGSKIIDISGNIYKKFDFTINSLNPLYPSGVTINYEKLNYFWPAYGYATLKKKQDLEDIKNDGIWFLDFNKNKKKLLISLEEVTEFLKLSLNTRNKVFFTHTLFNPSGDKFIFLARYFNDDNSGMITNMFCYNFKNKNFHLLASGKISHFDWITNETLIVWMRNSKISKQILKKDFTSFNFVRSFFSFLRKHKPKILTKFLGDAFYIISTNSTKKEPFLNEYLKKDGHQMVSHDGKWIILDEYPNMNKKIPIYLINIKSKKLLKICELIYETEIKNSDLKCDAHPRWSTDNKYIGVDTIEKNIRKFQIFDVSEKKKLLI